MRPFHALLLAIGACLLLSPAAVAGDVPLPNPPLPPGALFPEPAQRGLDAIDVLPERPAVCPACGLTVTVPLVDALMLARPNAPDGVRWQMHAASRDADGCPYPGGGKIAYQADIVVCPSCGLARDAGSFEQPLPPNAANWVLGSLRPALRAAERALLGARGEEMTEEEIIAWFNHQDRIPDTVRTEHYRTYLAAIQAPQSEQARACLLAAWAARREVARAPRGAFLARRAERITADLAAGGRGQPGPAADIAALRGLLRRLNRDNDGALPGARHMAIRLLMAGLWERRGFLDVAETLLQELYHECRERFLRPDQDPLWQSTRTSAAHTERLNELERFRDEAEAEILVRLEMCRRERLLAATAADALRGALAAGEYDNNPAAARYSGYMTAECLRRAGQLPLAAEWYKNLIAVAGETDLRRAAERQLEALMEEAGGEMDLLSALGQDGELFARIRRICAR